MGKTISNMGGGFDETNSSDFSADLKDVKSSGSKAGEDTPSSGKK